MRHTTGLQRCIRPIKLDSTSVRVSLKIQRSLFSFSQFRRSTYYRINDRQKIKEGPMSHDQPTYASVPGIRVYGMMCVDGKRRSRPLRSSRSLEVPAFPWKKADELSKYALWD
ncbi:hypothetical protein NQ314_020791 [Rhamnusium bicolor]|uniref:Uncharacterized protein n=1 Tax=Rhamnusium bicolor TaxID=1586634 RepID=A0AAV8WK17_9CUCU|nr:hypothetical protein NQ314_020791 [Rhamnusium bicolor]